jgi:hypothetical protein
MHNLQTAVRCQLCDLRIPSNLVVDIEVASGTCGHQRDLTRPSLPHPCSLYTTSLRHLRASRTLVQGDSDTATFVLAMVDSLSWRAPGPNGSVWAILCRLYTRRRHHKKHAEGSKKQGGSVCTVWIVQIWPNCPVRVLSTACSQYMKTSTELIAMTDKTSVLYLPGL